jgi:hypothetical protein
VLGFSLELPDETASVREVVDEFAHDLMAESLSSQAPAKQTGMRRRRLF